MSYPYYTIELNIHNGNVAKNISKTRNYLSRCYSAIEYGHCEDIAGIRKDVKDFVSMSRRRLVAIDKYLTNLLSDKVTKEVNFKVSVNIVSPGHLRVVMFSEMIDRILVKVNRAVRERKMDKADAEEIIKRVFNTQGQTHERVIKLSKKVKVVKENEG